MSARGSAAASATVIGGLAVRSFGPVGAPAIVLSSGLGGTGAYWTPQIGMLARSHRVVVYDHRGTGGSDRSDLPPGYGVRHLADDIAIVLDGLGIGAAHVVGHAAGAVAALDLAGRHPERVNSLTLVNGWISPSAHFSRCMALRRDIYRAGGADAYLRAQPVFLYPANWIEDHIEHLDAERRAQCGGFQSADTLFARMAALEAFDFRDRAAAVRGPALVVVADDDALVPPARSAELAAALPNARLARIATGGHAVNITQPQVFDDLVSDFLIEAGATL